MRKLIQRWKGIKNSPNAKRAVVFLAVFFLWSCEPTEPSHQSFSQSPEKQRVEQKQDNPFLIRGIYNQPALSLAEFNQAEQDALLRDLFEGLVIFDPQGNVIPGVAAHWQSKDGKNWLFTLRENARWSDGQPVVADDFVRAWQTLAQSEHPLKQYLAFLNVAHAKEVIAGDLPVQELGVKAINAKQLQITLGKPIPYLPKMLTHIALLPRPAENQGEVSNGAYQLQQQNAQALVLQKNPYYWAADKVRFAEVRYQIIQPQQAIGEMDVVAEPKQSNLKTIPFLQLCTYFYVFNLKDPYLQQTAVRKALVSMVSSAVMLKPERLSLRASHFFVPKNMQLEIELQWQNSYVEQLLQQQQISEKQPLQLKISYDQSGIHPQIANGLVQALSQSDLIRADSESLSWQQLQEKRQAGDFQLIRSGWCADYNDPSAFFNLLHSQNPDNPLNVPHPVIDQLLEKSVKPSISEIDRYHLYQQILTIVHEERLLLPLFQYSKPVYIHQHIAGYDVKNPTNVIYSKDLYRK